MKNTIRFSFDPEQCSAERLWFVNISSLQMWNNSGLLMGSMQFYKCVCVCVCVCVCARTCACVHTYEFSFLGSEIAPGQVHACDQSGT